MLAPRKSILRPQLLLLLLAALAVRPQPTVALSPTKAIVYSNEQYGFRLMLPPTWKGYTVLTADPWNGIRMIHAADGTTQEDPGKREHGPVLRIRNPHWTKADPHEDIPIMIFTLAQWAVVENETLITGAAPFPPSELARNARYVFALPPRYNFDYATGWKEVETILGGKPLHAF